MADHRDRHGRTARADNDLRHRPGNGFRTASRSRFEELVNAGLSTMPSDIAGYLREATVQVVDVPPTSELTRAEVTGEVPLARVELPASGDAHVQVYRRPLELRAATRPQLQQLIRGAIRAAVLDAIGRDHHIDLDDDSNLDDDGD